MMAPLFPRKLLLNRSVRPLLLLPLLVLPALSEAAPDCTLMVAGFGTTPEKASPDLTRQWSILATALFHDLSRALGQMGYRVQEQLMLRTDPQDRGPLLEAELQKTGCGHLLQVTYELTGQGGGFGITVSSLEQTAQKPRRAVRIVETYNVGYEFAPEKPKPTVSDLAASIAQDVDHAKVLPKQAGSG